MNPFGARTRLPAESTADVDRVRRPGLYHWLFLLVLFVAPLVAGHPDVLPPLVLGCLLWGALLLRLADSTAPPAAIAPGASLILLFLALAALSFLTSAAPGMTFIQVVLYSGYGVAFWLAADACRQGRGLHSLGAVAGGAVLVGARGFYEYLVQAAGGDPLWRITASFGNANFLSAYLVPAILVILGTALCPLPAGRTQRRAWITAGSAGTLLLGAVIVLAGSRSALLSLAGGATVLLVAAGLRRRHLPRGWLRRLTCLLAVLVGAGLLLSGPFRTRQTHLPPALGPPDLCAAPQRTVSTESNLFRLLTWQGSWRMGCERPLLGWGAGTYEMASAPSAVGPYTRHAHNHYLQLFAEGGGPALALWVVITALAIIGAWLGADRPGRGWLLGVAGALAATAAHGLADSVLFVPAVAILTWVLLGTALGAGQSVDPAGPPGTRGRRPWVALAVAGLLLTGAAAVGRALLVLGRTETGLEPARADRLLRVADTLLPWDHDIKVARAQCAARLGQPAQSLAAARTAVALAPEYPLGYRLLATLQEQHADLEGALVTYRRGLEHTPDEIALLYPYARLLWRRGERQEALGVCRRIVAVADSPKGEFQAFHARHYGIAIARAVLAQEVEGQSQAVAAAERKEAACFLAARRAWFDGNPALIMALAEWDPSTEAHLRSLEARLWRQLASYYSGSGDERLAASALAAAASAAAVRGGVDSGH